MTALWLCVFSVALMIGLPVVLAVLLRNRWSTAWPVFLAGVAAFIASQGVHLPMLWALKHLGFEAASWETVTVGYALVLGLAAGVCEESARAAMYRLIPRARSGADGLMFGLGHGGVESMLLGGVLLAASFSSLMDLRGTDLTLLGKSAAETARIVEQLARVEQSPLIVLLSPLERVLALSVQLSFSVLVLQAVRRKNVGYFIAAVLLHCLVDSTAVLVNAHFRETPWVALISVGVTMIPGCVWAVLLLRSSGLGVPRRASGTAAAFGRFKAVLRKELWQRARTWSGLVSPVLLLALGVGSPILVWALPAVLTAAVGTRPKADELLKLIPPASGPAALAQYLKLSSQLGFLVAVLIGAVAIAGERQRGTLAMLFSKPVPRWEVVVAKWLAQSTVLAVSVALGTLGLCVCSGLLFGSFAVGTCLAINALLLLWLITFAAIATVGSALGKTDAVAIGLAFLGAFTLLALSAIPGVGGLGPIGLTAWGYELAKGVEVHTNGGAVALCSVVVILSLLGAVAVVERTEL